jgi:transcriptional regulatory protein LEU3
MLAQAQRRTACNECRQQKLKCDLTTTIGEVCSRCQKLYLECRLDVGFRRSRKRKGSNELHGEIQRLKSQLSKITEASTTIQQSGSTARVQPCDTDGLHQHLNPDDGFLAVGVASEQPTLTAVTTRPHDHELHSPVLKLPAAGRIARAIDGVAVEVDEIDDLFSIYFAHYHSLLPILRPEKPPHDVYEECPVLFWCVVAVAARHSETLPILLRQLAQPVLDLLWSNIRCPPYTMGLVQAILLISTWPFPTNSSATDQTYTLTSVAVNASIQMGLHRPINQHDFVKYRFHLSEAQVQERLSTWTACNIIANRVATGMGLQSPARLHDCPTDMIPTATGATSEQYAQQLLVIERFMMKVSESFTANMTDTLMLRPTEQRIPFYTTLAEELSTLESNSSAAGAHIKLCIAAARLHLEAYVIFDEPSTYGYDGRILSLHAAVLSFMQHVLDVDGTTTITRFAPYWIYQTLSLACFILLKVLRNDYFSGLVNSAQSKKHFNQAMSAMRKLSVTNNDVPGRVCDVLAYLWSMPDATAIGGKGQQGLELAIRSRLSMSVVYDSLWKWRDQFRAPTRVDGSGLNPLENEEFDDTAFRSWQDLPTDDLFWDWFR